MKDEGSESEALCPSSLILTWLHGDSMPMRAGCTSRGTRIQSPSPKRNHEARCVPDGLGETSWFVRLRCGTATRGEHPPGRAESWPCCPSSVVDRRPVRSSRDCRVAGPMIQRRPHAVCRWEAQTRQSPTRPTIGSSRAVLQRHCDLSCGNEWSREKLFAVT